MINVLSVLIGALLGTAVGVLRSLGSGMAVALPLTVVFSLDSIVTHARNLPVVARRIPS